MGERADNFDTEKTSSGGGRSPTENRNHQKGVQHNERNDMLLSQTSGPVGWACERVSYGPTISTQNIPPNGGRPKQDHKASQGVRIFERDSLSLSLSPLFSRLSVLLLSLSLSHLSSRSLSLLSYPSVTVCWRPTISTPKDPHRLPTHKLSFVTNCRFNPCVKLSIGGFGFFLAATIFNK